MVRRASAALVALGGALAFAFIMAGRTRIDGAANLAVAMKPRVIRVALEEPMILPARPPRLEARAPKNKLEAMVAPFDRWIHPIPDDQRWLPHHPSVRFGAPRPGRRAERCGRGHCGVDLAALRSTPVVSIGDGVVERVEKDRRSRAGLYVTVAHDDGRVVSQYMHLDHIRDDLAPGKRVRGGEWLGSLGRTGVRESDPHLHFGVQVRLSKKRHRSVDPEPLLRRAEVIGLLEMKVLE